jgi:hypothetical protein
VKRIALLALIGCNKQAAAPTTIRTDVQTPLQIIVLDDYASKETCDGVIAKKVEVIFDGKSAGVVEVPCRTKTVMPPPQIAGPTVTLEAGKHTVVAREIGLGNSVEREIELPVISSSAEDGTDELATKLAIWVSDDEVEVMAPAVRIEFTKE